jgi:hypothetical protein
MTASEQLTKQHFAGLHGLTETEAASRLRTEGFNELPAAKARNIFQTARAQPPVVRGVETIEEQNK